MFLRVRPHGRKIWLIGYEVSGKRTKYTIGVYEREGAPGDSIPNWLRYGRLSLTQARAIAGNWKDARRAGHDPAAEWEALLASERGAQAARKAAEEAETARPTVSQTIDTFMARHMAGKARHVFESPLRPGQALYGRAANNALSTLFVRGALPNVTRCVVHDLRRTLVPRLPDLGFEPFIGHKIANHVLPGVLAHYNHNSYDAQREAALKAWAERTEALAKGKNVVQLQRSA